MSVSLRVWLLLIAGALIGDPSAASAEDPASDVAPAPETARPPHPEPRVIINVLSVRGPHERKDVERSARMAWGRIVKCYKSIDQQAKGSVALELVVAGSGKVTGSRRTHSTLKNAELVGCLTNAMKGLAMPKASRRSTATTEIHVAPADPPGR